jgi:hypothetical protein
MTDSKTTDSKAICLVKSIEDCDLFMCNIPGEFCGLITDLKLRYWVSYELDTVISSIKLNEFHKVFNDAKAAVDHVNNCFDSALKKCQGPLNDEDKRILTIIRDRMLALLNI